MVGYYCKKGEVVWEDQGVTARQRIQAEGTGEGSKINPLGISLSNDEFTQNPLFPLSPTPTLKVSHTVLLSCS